MIIVESENGIYHKSQHLQSVWKTATWRFECISKAFLSTSDPFLDIITFRSWTKNFYGQFPREMET